MCPDRLWGSRERCLSSWIHWSQFLAAPRWKILQKNAHTIVIVMLLSGITAHVWRLFHIPLTQTLEGSIVKISEQDCFRIWMDTWVQVKKGSQVTHAQEWLAPPRDQSSPSWRHLWAHESPITPGRLAGRRLRFRQAAEQRQTIDNLSLLTQNVWMYASLRFSNHSVADLLSPAAFEEEKWHEKLSSPAWQEAGLALFN